MVNGGEKTASKRRKVLESVELEWVRMAPKSPSAKGLRQRLNSYTTNSCNEDV